MTFAVFNFLYNTLLSRPILSLHCGISTFYTNKGPEYFSHVVRMMWKLIIYGQINALCS